MLRAPATCRLVVFVFVKSFFFAFFAVACFGAAARFADFFGGVRFFVSFFCAGFDFLLALFFEDVDFFLVFFLVAMGAV